MAWGDERERAARRLVGGLWAGLLMCAAAAAQSVVSPRLPPDVEFALQQAKVPREAVVAMVLEVERTEARLAWQPMQPANPGSLMKLLTTYAGLDLLGPAWTWSTPVWMLGPVRDGVLEGSLYVKGSGDPKLVLERLWLMLRRVQQSGVHEIRGDIVLDGSAFAPATGLPGDFDGEPLKPYNVQADALLLNYKSVVLGFAPDPARGVARVSMEPPLAGVRLESEVPLSAGACGDWRSALRADYGDPSRIRFQGAYPAGCQAQNWPVAYAEPATYNARLVEALWAEMGGRLAGRGRDGVAPTSPPTFEIASPPLAEVIRDINKFSNNVMAQQLFLTLGLQRGGAGTPDAARAVMRQWLAEQIGEAARGTAIDNGSGLSRDTRLTALALARLLQQAWASPSMPELTSSLPLSGLDGTLRRSRAPTGRAHLKTGSLRDMAGIAGYVLADSGRRYVVVAMINHPNAGAARPALDALVQWTARDEAQPRLGLAEPR